MNFSRSRLARVGALLALLLSACAPDAWQSYKATGFNEYLDTVGAKCQPLWIGNMYLQPFAASAVPGQGGNFDMLLDLTSRLYYNRMTPAAYREAVQSQFLAVGDARTNRSIDCMVAHLPPDRPRGPPGGVLN